MELNRSIEGRRSESRSSGQGAEGGGGRLSTGGGTGRVSAGGAVQPVPHHGGGYHVQDRFGNGDQREPFRNQGFEHPALRVQSPQGHPPPGDILGHPALLVQSSQGHPRQGYSPPRNLLDHPSLQIQPPLGQPPRNVHHGPLGGVGQQALEPSSTTGYGADPGNHQYSRNQGPGGASVHDGRNYERSGRFPPMLGGGAPAIVLAVTAVP